MKKAQKIVIGAIIVAIAFLAMVAVSASLRIQNTPLYTYRMEQTSSKMNFLPTEMNRFAYITEKGYTLEYGAAEEFCGAELSGYTCNPFFTCLKTCYNSTVGCGCDTQFTCPQTWCTCLYTFPCPVR